MVELSVIYSVGVKLAGGGYGNTAYHAVRGIYRHDGLKKVIAFGSARTEIPKELIACVHLPVPPGVFYRVLPHATYALALDSYFDWRAQHWIDDCAIFHGWVHQMSRQAQRARANGALVVTNGASSHPATQVRLVQEEYARFGFSQPVMSRESYRISCRDLEIADHIIAASEFAVTSLLEAGIPPPKISRVPFGVDTLRFKPDHKRDDIFRAMFVGTVCLRKGVQYLLQAWEELNLKRAELVLVGPVTPDAKPIAARYEHRGDIVFRGFVSDPVDAYQQASVFVFPSIEEGSALVTYEAMACGLPLIVTHHSGSVARDGVDGFVLPIRDVAALKERIAWLYENEDQRREMGQAARKRVENFSWEKYGDAMVEVYRRLLEKNGVSSPVK